MKSSPRVPLTAAGLAVGLTLGAALWCSASPSPDSPSPAAAPTPRTPQAQARSQFGVLPLLFTSADREDPRAEDAGSGPRYVARGAGYAVALDDTSIVVALPSPSARLLRWRIEGASPDVALRPELPIDARVHELTGGDAAWWRTDLQAWQRVRYLGVYAHTDLIFYGAQGGRLEYDFEVAPQGDPAAIALRLEGADALEIGEAGDLLVHTAGGTLRHARPKVYQDIAGDRRRVDGAFRLLGEGRVGFTIGAYDRAHTLVIDPILEFQSVLEGSGDDRAYAVAVGPSGDVYVAGETSSTNFPSVVPLQPANAGGRDAFLARLRPSDGQLLSVTYMGGSAEDSARAVAVDASGIYLAGFTTSSNYPVPNAKQPACASCATGKPDAFITKLSPAANAIVFSTFVGGTGHDEATGIGVDTSGAIAIAGWTASTDFPLTAALRTTLGGPNDAFAYRLSADGASTIYSTYLGGRETDYALALAVAADGSAWLAGGTASDDFPTASPIQSALHASGYSRSLDGGVTWTGVQTTGIPRAGLLTPANTTQVLYTFDPAGTVTLGTNNGQTWTTVATGVTAASVGPGQDLYTMTEEANFDTTVRRSTDGGTTWTPVFSGQLFGSIVGSFPDYPLDIVADPVRSGRVFLIGLVDVWRSEDGGVTWPRVVVDLGCFDGVRGLAFGGGGRFYIAGADVYRGHAGASCPTAPGAIITPPEGDANWRISVVPGVGVDTLYAGDTEGEIYRSADSGDTWTRVTDLPEMIFANQSIDRIAADPRHPGRVFAVNFTGTFRSTDSGATWQRMSRGLQGAFFGGALPFFPADRPDEVWAPGGQRVDGFVTSLTPAGALQTSTYLGGGNDERLTAITIAPGGRVLVAGTTRSLDFPTLQAFQPALSDGDDAVVAGIAMSTGALLHSSFLGGQGNDFARGIAADSVGAVIVTGSSHSLDFPVINASPALGFCGCSATDSAPFVARIDATGAALQYAGAYNPHRICTGCSAHGEVGSRLIAAATGPAGATYLTGVVGGEDGIPDVTLVNTPRDVKKNEVLIAKLTQPTCAFEVSPTSAGIGAAGGPLTIFVTVTSGCHWSTLSQANWITAAGGTAGNGVATLTVAANTGPARSGTALVAGVTVTINQAAADTCVTGLSLTNLSAPATGVRATVQVTAPAGCAWAASSDAGWIVPSGPGGSGGGAFPFDVSRHEGTAARTGTIRIGGWLLTVTQNGWAYRRYFAEGATGTFFDTRLAILNPNDTADVAWLRFQRVDGLVVHHDVPVPARARVTLHPRTIANLEATDFSVVVGSQTPLIVDRAMTWDATGFGSHAEASVEQPSTTWYLAEGSTSGDFSLFYLLQNPNPTPVDAKIRYLRSIGGPIEITRTLAANSRTTIPVDAEGPELASTDLSAVITATGQIIVERAMYMSRPGQPFAAGHESAGVTGPATSWFLAEGATGPFFDLFILIANPDTRAAQVTIDYLLLTGETHTKSYTVPGESRFTIWVDEEQIPANSGIRPLVNVAVSSRITSTNGVPIIVERVMWWPSPELGPNYWTEAHNSPGATATGTRWGLAEGEVGGSQNADTYILIANPSTTSGTAQVTLYFEDGTSAQKMFALPATSRTNVSVSGEFPTAAGRRFGAVVESVGSSPAPIVVERAIYTSPGGITWAAGTNALATRIQ